jgi:hypothetical protein
MKKKSIFLIVSIIILIAVLFLAINFLKQKKFEESFEYGGTDPCGKFINIMTKARTDNKPKICKKISDKRCSMNCIVSTAVHNSNETYCALIPDEFLRSNCYDQVGQSGEKPEACNLITTKIHYKEMPYYCIGLNTFPPKQLEKGGFLCAPFTWTEECIIGTRKCSRLTNKKIQDICKLASYYQVSSRFDCNSLNLPESIRLCNLAKAQTVGFSSGITDENLQETCGNSLCDEQEYPGTCPQDCKEGYGGCIVEGHVTTENSVGCCEGLTEATKTRQKINGEFICKDISNSKNYRKCLKLNDGICSSREDSCNSPSDCK